MYQTSTAEIGLTLGLNFGPLPEEIPVFGRHAVCADFLSINGDQGFGVSLGLNNVENDNRLRAGLGWWGDGEFAVYLRTAILTWEW